MIDPRRENQMMAAIMAGIPWRDMELDPPLDEEEVAFFEAVRQEHAEMVAEYGSCALQPSELDWDEIPDVYHDDDDDAGRPPRDG